MKRKFWFIGLSLFLIYSNLGHTQNKALYSCLESINNDFELSGIPHQPNNYYFSVISKSKNKFLLLSEKKSYLCETHEELKPSSTIDIMQNIPLISKKINYFQLVSNKIPPQKKVDKTFLDGKYLIAHQTFESAIELPSENNPPGSKNTAECKVTSEESLLDQGLVKIAKIEILDLQADWSEHLDSLSMAYGFDTNAARKEFEKKLQRVLEKCSQVSELKEAVKKTADRIGLKFSGLVDESNSSYANRRTKKSTSNKNNTRPTLPSGTKQ